MSKMKCEAVIDGFSFLLKDDVIEVWNSVESEYPDSFIYLKPGSVTNEKDFHYEAMAWMSNNT